VGLARHRLTEANKEIYDIPDHDFKPSLELKFFDAERLLDSPPRTLSLGERMKCELIAAILHKPKVLFLDEPTIGLDIVMQRQVREFIKSFNKKYDSTIMLTRHYLEDVKELCARVLIIHSGVLVYDGPLADLARKGVDFAAQVVFTPDQSTRNRKYDRSSQTLRHSQSLKAVP
jgi:ABC-2 type transport system ATP-binding protein